jgi:hypothetical protein
MRKQLILSVLVVIGFWVCGATFGNQFGLDSSVWSATNPATMPEKSMSSGRHEPPPQAYEDCKGKKAGDTVQHATPEGKVAATCVDSPQGLVARPSQPRGNQPNIQPRQSIP